MICEAIETLGSSEKRGAKMSAVYRITEKKCATCRWWNGGRQVDFNGGSNPVYVKVGNSNATCVAKSNVSASAATNCPRWMRWEKL